MYEIIKYVVELLMFLYNKIIELHSENIFFIF